MINQMILILKFLFGDVPHSPSYGLSILQLISFAIVCFDVDDSNNKNLFLTAKIINTML